MPMWPVDREVQSVFFKAFYGNIPKMPASEALAEAQFAVKDRYPEEKNWGSYRLLGYGGMRPDERIQYPRTYSVPVARINKDITTHICYVKMIGLVDCGLALGDDILWQIKVVDCWWWVLLI